MEYTREEIYELGKEKFVTDLVGEILSSKDELDASDIKEVIFDDNGACIHLTLSSGVSASTIIAIGEAFGDDDPDVFGNDESTFTIVFINYKYDCLIEEEEAEEEDYS